MRALLQSIGLRETRPPGANGRRAVIVHLDGVSRRVLSFAAREGRIPFIEKLLSRRGAELSPFLAGAPASTSAFQAGLLYGQVDDVPGYLWWNKRRNALVRMDQAMGVTDVEGRHARRDPGLLAGGTSYSTLFTGGATPAVMNLGRAWRLQWNSNFRHWPLSAAAAVQTALGAKLLGRLATRAPRYLASGASWAARVGRHDWELRLFWMRLLTSILLREIATWGTIGDMAIGAPIVYTCLVDYDEVAHRRGPRHPEALEHLSSIDRSVEKIFAAAAAFPERRYDVYVLADHGMVDSVPFSKIDGRDLQVFLHAALEGSAADTRNGTPRGLGPPPGMRVVDAGDLAHLYFTDDSEPLPIEAITRRHARVLAALRGSPAVPLIAARSLHGPVAMLAGRTHHLEDAADRAALAAHPLFAGRETTTLFSYIARLAGMRSAGDLVLYGNAGPGSAVAFSWEFGSHGGLASDEIESFVLHSPGAGFDFAAVRQPEQFFGAFVPYRPPLPRDQDVIGAPEALSDASPAALRSGCDGCGHAGHADAPVP